jgi:hypothetical protein
MTHVWNQELETEFLKILNTKYPDSRDVWLILDSRTPGAEELARRFERCHVIVKNELFLRFPYPWLDEKTLFDNIHFYILDFFLSHPEYDYYWIIESDVRYTGEWGTLLNSFGAFDHDLITSHIRRIAEEPDMYWYNYFQHPSKTIDRANYVRSFNVIYRISNRALSFIHSAQQDGWQGHQEVLIPTLLDHGGYTLLDFGGDGTFTLPHLRNRFYTSGSTRDGVENPFCTMRWRPSRSRAGIFRNKIYHPVKPASMMEPVHERFGFFTRWIRNYIREKFKTRN